MTKFSRECRHITLMCTSLALQCKITVIQYDWLLYVSCICMLCTLKYLLCELVMHSPMHIFYTVLCFNIYRICSGEISKGSEKGDWVDVCVPK